jgi:hypothetical protein
MSVAWYKIGQFYDEIGEMGHSIQQIWDEKTDQFMGVRVVWSTKEQGRYNQLTPDQWVKLATDLGIDPTEMQSGKLEGLGWVKMLGEKESSEVPSEEPPAAITEAGSDDIASISVVVEQPNVATTGKKGRVKTNG